MMTRVQKLQALMVHKKLTSVAREVGVHYLTLRSYLRGAVPSAEILFRVARVLGVSADWLLDDSQGWPPVRVESPRPPELEPVGERRTTAA